MTRDDIIRMAESVGVHEYGPHTRNWSFELSQLERFATLVAAAEREACAKVCEERYETGESYIEGTSESKGCAAAIRARGQA